LKDAAINWMAGASAEVVVAAKKGCKEPPFQVDKPLEDNKPATSLVNNRENDYDKDNKGTPTYDAMANDEEADGVTEAQMVTPSGSKQTPVAEEPTTVKQYQAIIKNYQVQLLHVDHQIRAILKTNLAGKFLENEVRNYVKESLWKR
jgi:hypothetical protein